MDDRPLRQTPKDGPKPGKKTKGRVKIKMEFIDNKLRRYTTFSKRKTGIMKKAYELSTLTGTQVMLLVASETGHVYTFATRKLQPMITSESGKALIQTCLNSPDPPMAPTGAGVSGVSAADAERRMNPNGYEETELNYSVLQDEEEDEDDVGGSPSGNPGSPLDMSAMVGPGGVVYSPHAGGHHDGGMSSSPSSGQVSSSQPATFTMTTMLPPTSTPDGGMSKAANMSVKLQAGSFAVIPSGTPISISTVQGQQQLQQQQAVAAANAATQQFFRFPAQVMAVPVAAGSGAAGGAAAAPGGTVMYQTPQGLLYAAAPSGGATAMLPDGYIVNVPAGQHQSLASALSAVAGGDASAASHHQFFIPVAVSMANSAVLQPTITQQMAGGEHSKK